MLLVAGLFLLISPDANSQVNNAVKIGDNMMNIDDGSLLELESTNGVFVPPRLTTAQRDLVATPLRGAVIYNTTMECFQVNYGTNQVANWQCVESYLRSLTTSQRDAMANVATGTIIYNTDFNCCLLYTSPSPRDRG